MATTAKPCFVPGVWGPYYSGMVPASGSTKADSPPPVRPSIIWFRPHPAYNEAVAAAHAAGMEVLEFLERRIVSRGQLGEAALLARDIHVLPEFLGNRSPSPIPIPARSLPASISTSTSARWSGFRGRALRARLWSCRCRRAFRSHGVDSDLMVISGGAGRSSLVRQIMADTTGLTVAVPETQEPVLLGAAMLGAVAAKSCGSSARRWPRCRRSAVSEPTAPGMADFHRTKRKVHG